MKPAIVLATVFLLGAVAGAGASRAYVLHELRSRFERPPGEVRANLRLEAMRRQLDLSDDQVERIEAIFREADGELDRARRPCRDELEALRKRTDERIVEVLEPAQRTRFQELSRRMRKRWSRGPFPGAHGPHEPPP